MSEFSALPVTRYDFTVDNSLFHFWKNLFDSFISVFLRFREDWRYWSLDLEPAMEMEPDYVARMEFCGYIVSKMDTNNCQ